MCIVANIKILVSTYELTVMSFVSALFGPAAYIGILVFFGYSSIYNMQGQFQHIFLAGPQPYAVMFFIITGFLLIDIGDRYAN